MASLPPAGWYPDPDGRGTDRYWTGEAWAPQVSPVLEAVRPPLGAEPLHDRPLDARATRIPVPPGVLLRAEPSNTMATVALVLALVAFVLGLIPYAGFITWTIAAPAAILGAVALRRPNGRGRAMAGLLVGLAGLLLGFVISVAAAAAVSSSDDAPAANPVPRIGPSGSSVADSDASDDGAASVAAVKAERADLVRKLEASIKKDAKKNVAAGLLEGPVLDVSCTPVGGSSDPLTDRSGTFTCFVSTDKDADGTEHGFSYSSTVNWDDGSYTWKYDE